MPTVMSHALVPIALGAGLGRGVVPLRLVAAGAMVAMLPDADVVAFHLGIPYADTFGHRGASHALLTATLIGLVGASAACWFRTRSFVVFLFLLVAMASHGLLDTLTNGGLGVALFWPWSDARIFAPVRPVEVSPIGLSQFLSPRGLAVIGSEILWIWIPCLLAVFGLRGLRRSSARTAAF